MSLMRKRGRCGGKTLPGVHVDTLSQQGFNDTKMTMFARACQCVADDVSVIHVCLHGKYGFNNRKPAGAARMRERRATISKVRVCLFQAAAVNDDVVLNKLHIAEIAGTVHIFAFHCDARGRIALQKTG
jgi:hypothetical protein